MWKPDPVGIRKLWYPPNTGVHLCCVFCVSYLACLCWVSCVNFQSSMGHLITFFTCACVSFVCHKCMFIVWLLCVVWVECHVFWVICGSYSCGFYVAMGLLCVGDFVSVYCIWLHCVLDLLLSMLHKTHTNESLFLFLL